MKTPTAALLLVSLALNALFAYRLWFADPAVASRHTTDELVVMRTEGGRLEVSTISAEERFDSTSTHTIFGVDVGKTVAQIRVPVVYRYHLALAKDWSFRLNGRSLVVVAPAVVPSLPVAIDTGKLEAFSSGLWSPITGQKVISSLQRSITGALAKKAESRQLVLLQRESARQTVTEFVQKWVVGQERWKGSKAPTVLVFFADEPLGSKAAPLISEAP